MCFLTGTAIAGLFGVLPNTSFSQNVGLIPMTGVMSRHVVTCGAIFLVIAGLVPKVEALVSTMPIEVLGGGVIALGAVVSGSNASLRAEMRTAHRPGTRAYIRQDMESSPGGGGSSPSTVPSAPTSTSGLTL